MAGDGFFATPIFIVSYNRVSALSRQVRWLMGAGYTTVFIVDNHSTYPPLLRYYEEIEGSAHGRVQLIRLDQNHGSGALWAAGILPKLGVVSPYVCTDSDVIPDESCPRDVVGHLASHLERNPGMVKVGLGLRIDDLPERYKFRDEVVVWERQFWRRPVDRGLFLAPVDTTFALYRPEVEFAKRPALRTGFPYLARHDPWYAASETPTDEDRFYVQSLLPGRTSWNRGYLPDWLDTSIAAMRRSTPTLLHLGRAPDPMPGWIAVRVLADVRGVHTFDAGAGPTARLPLDDDSVDGVYVYDAVEHIGHARGLMAEIHRLGRPGARLVIRLPHGGALDALRERGEWRVQRVKLVVDPDVLAVEGEARLLSLIETGRSHVRDTIVELAAVKPPRPRDPSLRASPRPTLTGSSVDEEIGF